MLKWRFNSDFSMKEIEKHIKNNPDFLSKPEPLTIDLKAVHWFDIGALVFIVSLISALRRKGIIPTLVLPYADEGVEDKAAIMAHDFLLRWKVRDALQIALNGRLGEALKPEQADYFNKKPKYYTQAEIRTEYGELEMLSSLRLLRLQSFCELVDGIMKPSRGVSDAIVSRAAKRSLQLVLRHTLGCSESWASSFGKVLIAEALINAVEHPKASTALIAMAVQGNHLIIAVGDDGDVVPRTIARVYDQDDRIKANQNLPAEPEKRRHALDANRIAYATWSGTSSKSNEIINAERGMGLYYLKVLTTEVGGYVIIRARNASLRFHRNRNGEHSMNSRHVFGPDQCNLIQIFLPIKNTF